MDGVTEVHMTHSGLKNEFLAFQLPPTQSSIENTREVEYSPLTAPREDGESQIIEFYIPGSSEEFIDLDSVYLQVRLKYELHHFEEAEQTTTEKDDKGEFKKVKITRLVPSKDIVNLVNNTLHSLFERVELQIGGETVNKNSNLYQYRAYIENLLGYSAEAKDTILEPSGWYIDHRKTSDEPYVERYDKFPMMVYNEFYGTLHLDLAGQDKLIMNGTSVRLSLHTTPKRFYFHLMSGKRYDFDNFKVDIKDVKLFVTKKRATTAQLQITDRQLLSRPACYPIRRVEMREHLAVLGSMSVSLDNIYSGVLPNRLIVGLVENAAVRGDLYKDPFNFEHANINYACCFVNGEAVPRTPYRPDFIMGLCKREYISLFQAIGKMNAHPFCDINIDAYRGGSTLLCFNLSADGSDSSSGHFNPVRRGTMRLDLGFSQATTKTYSIILYAEFDGVITIDHSRKGQILF